MMRGTLVWVFSSLVLATPSYTLALATVESRTGVPLVRSSENVTTASSPVSLAGEEHTARFTLKQIEDLKQEISELRGLIEVQEHEIQRLKKSQQDLYLDLDKRMSELRPQEPKAKRKISAANDTAESKDNGLLIEDKPAIVSKEERSTIVLESSKESPPTAVIETVTKEEHVSTASVSNLAPSAEKDTFESAYKLVRTKRYSEAASGFREYLAKFPQGENAPNAHYWLGEVYMSQWQANKTKKELLDKANQEFLNITSKFPTHQKVTDALLKLGLIENEKGNLEAARQYLTEVKDRYPGSAAARIAETRLQQLH